jgi:hypothetical protein
LLQVDFFDTGGGTHYAFELATMMEAEGVSEFMRQFLFQPLQHERIMPIQSIELVREPVSGDHCRRPGELCFTEYECKDGDEQVNGNNPNPFFVGFGNVSQNPGQQAGRIGLASGGVKGGSQIELRPIRFDRDREDPFDPARYLIQVLLPEGSAIEDVNLSRHLWFP